MHGGYGWIFDTLDNCPVAVQLLTEPKMEVRRDGRSVSCPKQFLGRRLQKEMMAGARGRCETTRHVSRFHSTGTAWGRSTGELGPAQHSPHAVKDFATHVEQRLKEASRKAVKVPLLNEGRDHFVYTKAPGWSGGRGGGGEQRMEKRAQAAERGSCGREPRVWRCVDDLRWSLLCDWV